MSALRVRALIATFALFACCVRAAAAQSVGALPGGGVSILNPTGGAPAAAIELWYRAPSIGFGETPVLSLARLAAEVVVASKPLAGKPLGTTIAEAGGRITVNVYADSLAISVLAPAAAAPEIVRAMTTAFFAPVVTEDGYREAKHAVEQEALIGSFNPDTLARDAVFGGLFSSGPAHYPVLGGARAIERISSDAVRSYATRAFRSQNAVLVTTGAVDASVVRTAVAGRTSLSVESGRAEPALSSTPARAPRLIAQSSDGPGGAYGWIGPAIADERAATAMDFVADYLFRPELGSVARRLAQTQPQASVSGQFITLHDPGVFFVAFSADKPGEAKGIVDAGLATMREPLEAAAFERALNAFEYHLLSDLQTPLSVADNFGWYAAEGNLTYAPGANNDDGAYFHAVRSLTPAFVASVVRKYLDKPGVTVVLSPKAPAPKKGSAS
jgi:predicted Zn-dependent peptidase